MHGPAAGGLAVVVLLCFWIIDREQRFSVFFISIIDEGQSLTGYLIIPNSNPTTFLLSYCPVLIVFVYAIVHCPARSFYTQGFVTHRLFLNNCLYAFQFNPITHGGGAKTTLDIL